MSGITNKELASIGESMFRGNQVSVSRVPGMRSDIASLSGISSGDIDPKDICFIQNASRPEIASMLETLRNGRFDRRNRDDLKKYAELLKRAGFSSKSDMTAWNELAAYREFELTYDVMASPWALSGFQVVNLNDDELPLITIPRSRNLQRFAVQHISIDGETSRNQWRSTKDILQLEMEMLATEKVSYRLMDLQVGDVNESDAIQRELKYDLDMKVDSLALAQIDAGLMESGLRSILKVHPNINILNIPDKNYLDLTAVETAGKLSIGKLKTILAHIVMFGTIGGADEQFQISNIQVSPQNMQDPWDFVSMVSGWDSASDGINPDPAGTIPEPVRQQIYNTGMFTNAWGQSFSWVPNSTLRKGRLYVFTNKPIGWCFMKPGLDKLLTWDERTNPDYAERNYGEMMFKKAISFYMPDIWRQRYLVVDF